MTKDQGRTDQELLEALGELFAEIEVETSEEIDEELRAFGHDPEAIAARMQPIADSALAQSPSNWRNKVVELEKERSRLDALTEKVGQTREEMVATIQELRNQMGGKRPVLAFYRNLDEETNEDLASYIVELKHLLNEDASDENAK